MCDHIVRMKLRSAKLKQIKQRMDNALPTVRNINHKYIVVEMRKYEKSKRDYSVL